VDCVFLSGFDHDVRVFTSMLGPGRISVHGARTIEMADFLLLATGGTVLVLDAHFPDGDWRDALALMRSVHPQVAPLICAEADDRILLEEARDLGALDVLRRPLEIERLRAAIRAAHEVAMERLGAAART
jgi:DNA-binding response OmpR family regulator